MEYTIEEITKDFEISLHNVVYVQDFAEDTFA